MKRVYLHYHLPNKRVVTHDLSPPTLEDQYRDLAERLQAALAVQGHSTDPSLRIAAGVAIYDLSGAVLLMKRRPDCEDHPGEWSFPAGGIEPGETPEQALSRELCEELGIRPVTIAFFREKAHAYEHLSVRLHFFHVRAYDGEPLPLEGQDMEWLTPQEGRLRPFLEADRDIVDALALEEG